MGPEEKQIEIYQGESGEVVFDVDAEMIWARKQQEEAKRSSLVGNEEEASTGRLRRCFRVLTGRNYTGACQKRRRVLYSI